MTVRLFHTMISSEEHDGEGFPAGTRALHDAAWALLAASLHEADPVRFPSSSPAMLPAVGRLAHGKPFFTDRTLPHFSLSHSGRFAVCAICAEAAVGVDIQEMRTHIDIDGISRRFFHPAEQALLFACPDEDARRRLFFSLFSCKEAYVKMTGEGLSADFTKFSAEPDRRIVVAQGDTVGHLSFPAFSHRGYTLALCTEPAASDGSVPPLSCSLKNSFISV